MLTLLDGARRLLTNQPGDADPLPFHARTSAALAVIKLAIAEAENKSVDRRSQNRKRRSRARTAAA